MEPDVKTSQDVWGMALLMRKGMLAWMRGLSQLCAPPAVASAQQGGSSTTQLASPPAKGHASGVERMMVKILAAMTYSNTVEVNR